MSKTAFPASNASATSPHPVFSCASPCNGYAVCSHEVWVLENARGTQWNVSTRQHIQGTESGGGSNDGTARCRWISNSIVVGDFGPAAFRCGLARQERDPERETEVRLLWTPEWLFLRFYVRFRVITVFSRRRGQWPAATSFGIATSRKFPSA